MKETKVYTHSLTVFTLYRFCFIATLKENKYNLRITFTPFCAISTRNVNKSREILLRRMEILNFGGEDALTNTVIYYLPKDNKKQ